MTPATRLTVLPDVRAHAPSADVVAHWIEAVRALDGRTLDAGLRTEALRLGLLGALEQRIAPLMVRLGSGWRRGDIAIHQEHWATERVRVFLRDRWAPLAETARGPALIAATLPEDRHDLGLHMACAAVALAGWPITWVGADTPVDALATAVRATGAAGVLVSVSAWKRTPDARRELRALAGMLPCGAHLIVGGSGAPADLHEATPFPDLTTLHTWASALPR